MPNHRNQVSSRCNTPESVPRDISRRLFLQGAAATGAALLGSGCATSKEKPDTPDGGHAELVLINGQIATLDPSRPSATAAAIKDGRFLAVGTDRDIIPYRGASTQIVDLISRP